MTLLNHVKTTLIHRLWENYSKELTQAHVINQLLLEKYRKVVLDHFAIIDLPSEKTGIPILSEIFTCLGFIVQGRDYLPEKQNEFMWLVEQDAASKPVDSVLPQVVVADFCLAELPITIRKIVEKYTRQINSSPLNVIRHLTKEVNLGSRDAAHTLLTVLINYFNHRDWMLPSLADFRAVQEANELLAWVLLFGRRPNHFTISVHLLEGFNDLAEFHSFITRHVNCALHDQGEIKGNKDIGILQSSTRADFIKIPLAGGDIMIRDRFIEFIWRYRKNDVNQSKIKMWKDYYTGFVGNNANQVIESLFANESKQMPPGPSEASARISCG